MSMEVNRDFRNSILLPIITYRSETWTWNRYICQVCAVEMSYLRGVYGVIRWEGEINESVYERCGMGTCENRVMCGMDEIKYFEVVS